MSLLSKSIQDQSKLRITGKNPKTHLKLQFILISVE